MPPQIKQDLNRSGWETTGELVQQLFAKSELTETADFPSVCEQCLPDNPYVQMLKQDHDTYYQSAAPRIILLTYRVRLECKLCTRPFTVFNWKADRTSRSKRTNICLTCARLKNCCQCCMLDLSFGLPIVVRDAALKMVAPGPESGKLLFALCSQKLVVRAKADGPQA